MHEDLTSTKPADATLARIPLNQISPSAKNPRLTLKKAAFDELKASILGNGLLQPIAVRVVDDNYEIVGGHRRFHAFKELAREHPSDARFAAVPALVLEASDDRVAAMRLAENINREDLSPHEIAEGIADALESGLMSEAELAERLGWAKRNVYRYTQFHEAPPWLKDFTNAIPNPTKKLDADGKAVIDPATNAPVIVTTKLPGLPFTHVFDLITFYNLLHQHDVQQVDERGAEHKPQAERIIHKLARAAAEKEWSTAKLRAEIKRIKDPPTETKAPQQKKGAAPFSFTNKHVSIDLTRELDDKQRVELAVKLTAALTTLGFEVVNIQSAP